MSTYFGAELKVGVTFSDLCSCSSWLSSFLVSWWMGSRQAGGNSVGAASSFHHLWRRGNKAAAAGCFFFNAAARRNLSCACSSLLLLWWWLLVAGRCALTLRAARHCNSEQRLLSSRAAHHDMAGCWMLETGCVCAAVFALFMMNLRSDCLDFHHFGFPAPKGNNWGFHDPTTLEGSSWLSLLWPLGSKWAPQTKLCILLLLFMNLQRLLRFSSTSGLCSNLVQQAMIHAKFGRQRRICCSFICSNKGQELLMSDFYIFKVSHPWIARGAFGGDSFLFGMKKNMRFFPTIPLEPASQTAKTLMYRRVVSKARFTSFRNKNERCHMQSK